MHTHTTASDGMNSPSDNVRMAKQKGLSAVAITDHDTVAGVSEALQAGEASGITVVPGVEISTSAEGIDIHVLGYFIDHEDPVLLRRLQELRAVRERRNERIISNLQKLGVPLTMEEVLGRLSPDRREGESVGRPHIADALVAKGFADSVRDAFDNYLAEGAPAYARVNRISPQEAFVWIREAGGAPVLAHPGIYGNDLLVRSLLVNGQPAGLEVYHSDHSAEDEQRYREMAECFKLIVTGGSDYHGMRQGAVFHGEIGNRTVDAAAVKRLKEWRDGR
nr:PHP domain-containing protein [Paenibacillus caui]